MDTKEDKTRARWRERSKVYYDKNKEAVLFQQKKYYADNKSKRLNRQRTNIQKVRVKLAEYKECRPCTDCGNYYLACVMDFDHLDPKQKILGVSTAASRGWGWVRLLTEIDKCELVCANCHRVRTHKK